MAAKRIFNSSINWREFAARIPSHEKVQFTAFKTKSDSYLRRVLSYPEEVPAIDWNFYKKNVKDGALVESFQKSYANVKIPYPVETKAFEQIDEIQKNDAVRIEDFVKGCNTAIAEHKVQLDKLKAMMPFEEMTMQDGCELVPSFEERANELAMYRYQFNDTEPQEEDLSDSEEEPVKK